MGNNWNIFGIVTLIILTKNEVKKWYLGSGTDGRHQKMQMFMKIFSKKKFFQELHLKKIWLPWNSAIKTTITQRSGIHYNNAVWFFWRSAEIRWWGLRKILCTRKSEESALKAWWQITTLRNERKHQILSKLGRYSHRWFKYWYSQLDISPCGTNFLHEIGYNSLPNANIQ